MLSQLDELKNVNVKNYYDSIVNKADYEHARSARHRFQRKAVLLERKFAQKQFQDSEGKKKRGNSKRNKRTEDEKEEKIKKIDSCDSGIYKPDKSLY